jgi:hypothetical protein
VIGPDARKAVPLLLRALERHGKEEIGDQQLAQRRSGVMGVLSRIDPKNQVFLLRLTGFATDYYTPQGTRRDAIRYIGAMGSAADPAGELLFQLFLEEGPVVRQDCLMALKSIRGSGLRALLKEFEQRPTDEMISAIAQLGPVAANARPTLEALEKKLRQEIPPNTRSPRRYELLSIQQAIRRITPESER